MFDVFIPLLVMHFLAAHGLKHNRRYTLVLVMAALTCLSFPRPSVKARFATA